MDLDSIEQNLSPALKQALPYLLVGGGGAALGGLATGGRHKQDHESRLGYAARIAKNMALAGGLAGGSAYALKKGLDSVNNSIDYANPRTGSDPTTNPVASLVRSTLFSPVTAGAAGLGTLAAVKGKIGKDLVEARTSLNKGGEGFKGMFADRANPFTSFDTVPRADLTSAVAKRLAASPGDASLMRDLHVAGAPTYAANAAAKIDTPLWDKIKTGEGTPLAHRLKAYLHSREMTDMGEGAPDRMFANGDKGLGSVNSNLDSGNPHPFGARPVEGGAFGAGDLNAGGSGTFNPGGTDLGAMSRTVDMGSAGSGAINAGTLTGRPAWKRILSPIADAAASPTADKTVGTIERLFRRYPGRLLGQTPLRMAGRLALGTAAAMTPSVLGSILTDPVKQ